MFRYYWLEIMQTQAFDMIIGVICIIPFYFLMKMHITKESEKIFSLLTELIESDEEF